MSDESDLTQLCEERGVPTWGCGEDKVVKMVPEKLSIG